jgi:hypothetical protein
MSSRTHSIFAFTALQGHAIGLGDPHADNPVFAPTSLLCAVTFVPISVEEWTAIISEVEDIESAVNRVLRTHGGIRILRPSDIHMGPISNYAPAGSIAEC